MVFTKYLKYRRIIESIMLFIFIYKTFKQINKIPIECSRKRRENVLPGRGHFFRHYEQINFTTKQLKLVKNPNARTKMAR